MRDLVEEAIAWGKTEGGTGEAAVHAVCDRLAVTFGAELAGIVPGRVSTEVDADLSFDTEATIDKARAIIAAYKQRGIEKDRILIKIASTWEGIQAAQGAAGRGHRLQPDAALRAAAGGRLRRCRAPS